MSRDIEGKADFACHPSNYSIFSFGALAEKDGPGLTDAREVSARGKGLPVFGSLLKTQESAARLRMDVQRSGNRNVNEEARDEAGWNSDASICEHLLRAGAGEFSAVGDQRVGSGLSPGG
jgi:hypothetical protein